MHVPASPISYRPTGPKRKPKPECVGFGFSFGRVGRHEIGDVGTCTFKQEATMELFSRFSFNFIFCRIWPTVCGQPEMVDVFCPVPGFGQLEIVDFFARFLLRHDFGKTAFARNSLQKNAFGKNGIWKIKFGKKTHWKKHIVRLLSDVRARK